MKRLLMILFACICFAAHADDSVVLDQKEFLIEIDSSSAIDPLLRAPFLQGRVVDKTTRTGVPYATVLLFDMSENYITGVAADQYGYFRIPISVGTFIMEVSASAYPTCRFEVTVTDNGATKEVEISPLD